MKNIKHNNNNLIIGIFFILIGAFVNYKFYYFIFDQPSVKIAIYVLYCTGLIGVSSKIENRIHPIIIGICLMFIGLTLQYIQNFNIVKTDIGRNFNYLTHFFLKGGPFIDSLLLIGGYNIIEGFYFFPLQNMFDKPFKKIFKYCENFFKYINSLKVISLFKAINSIFIIPIIIAIVVSIYLVPKITNYFEVKNSKKEAYAKIVYSLNNDESIYVRKAAVMGIGNIGNKESINLLTDTITKQPDLALLISNFLKIENDTKREFDNINLFHELKKVHGEDELLIKDYQQRVIYMVNDCMDEIRGLRKWFKEDLEMSVAEKEYITKIGMLDNIDSAINKLNEIAAKNTDSSLQDNYDFFVMSDKINSEIEEFINRSNKLIKDSKSKSTVILFLNEFNDNIKSYEKQITYKKSNYNETTVEKYITIIRSLVETGQNNTIVELENISTNKDIAFSIRLKAIESLGIIGEEKQLSTLLKVSEDEDPLIRSFSIAAICMILTDIRDINQFDPFVFEEDQEGGGGGGGGF